MFVSLQVLVNAWDGLTTLPSGMVTSLTKTNRLHCGLIVGVGVRVLVGVLDGVSVAVGVKVRVGVLEGVQVAVGEGVRVGVRVGVLEGVDVKVGV